MQQELIKRAYHYSDICLVPNKGVLNSRAQADTSIKLGRHEFLLPVIPSNMKCTIDWELAYKLAQNNYFYVMHRFDSSNKAFINWAIDAKIRYLSISVGVKEEDRQLISFLKTLNVTPGFITLDIAHGHSLASIEMIKFIKDNLPDTFLIAGNIATSQAAVSLVEAGASALKVGIGQGNACTTKDKTGFTMPMFTCVREIADTVPSDIAVIADGGVKCNGDIAKALAAGASMVMCGSLFAECSDSPSDIFEDEQGQVYKLYFGSASVHNKTEHKHIEGTLKKVPQNTMTYIEKLEELKQDLSSAISYSGGTTLQDLRKVEVYATK